MLFNVIFVEGYDYNEYDILSLHIVSCSFQFYFHKLRAYDLAVCCSHVNSYPGAKRFGKCPFDLLGTLLSKEFLDELGLEKVASDDVVLKPYLMKHAVKL